MGNIHSFFDCNVAFHSLLRKIKKIVINQAANHSKTPTPANDKNNHKGQEADTTKGIKGTIHA